MAASVAQRRALDARLNLFTAGLFWAATAYTLWTGFELMRADWDLVSKAAAALLLAGFGGVAAAQFAAGFALLQRRRGVRWFAACLCVLVAAALLLAVDLFGVFINAAGLVLLVRTWNFNPREAAALANPASQGHSGSSSEADMPDGGRAAPRRRSLRYVFVFGLAFGSVCLPGLLLSRWSGVGGATLLSVVAATVAWQVARSRPSMPGGEGFRAYGWAAALAATVLAACCSAIVWLWVSAVSISGTPFDAPQVNFAWVFARAWIASWLTVVGVQFGLGWLYSGSLRSA